jgi:hypothetical protein
VKRTLLAPFAEEAPKRERVRCSSLVHWLVYPRLAHTMRASRDAQCGAGACVRTPRSVARRAEIASAVEKVIEVAPQGWADRGAGCAARPLRWCKKEGNGRLRRVGTEGVFALRARPHATGTMHDTPFEHFAAAHGDMEGGTGPAPAISRQQSDNTRHRVTVGLGGRVRAMSRRSSGVLRPLHLFEHSHSRAHAGIRDGSDPRMLFQAKNLPIPAIRGHGALIAASPRDTPRNA